MADAGIERTSSWTDRAVVSSRGTTITASQRDPSNNRTGTQSRRTSRTTSTTNSSSSYLPFIQKSSSPAAHLNPVIPPRLADVYNSVNENYESWNSDGVGAISSSQVGSGVAVDSTAQEKMDARMTKIPIKQNDSDEDDIDFDANFDEICEDYSADTAEHIAKKVVTDGRMLSSAAAGEKDEHYKIAEHEHEISTYIDQRDIPTPSITPTRALEEENDDALARAIAEQGLPPGVSALEQQEIMMRLLTQRIRTGPAAAVNGGGGCDGVGGEVGLSPALEARLRDFDFAQRKRRENYGEDRPWGILGLYDHLAGIRLDVEWAEDAAWRRGHKEPYLSWSDFQTTRDGGWNRPFFTYIVLFVCTVVQIVSYGLNGWMIEPLSINPMIGPSAETLIRMGAKQTTLIVEYGEWFRLFSPMVLHAGLIHYFLNMTALWFIGRAVEQCHGFAAAVILFIIPAVGGTILSAIFLSEYISVGASGGIFGLIGACIADICMNWSLLFSKHVNASDEGIRFRHMKVLLWLLFDIVINCLIGLTPFVDNFTHLGGMIYGFLCGLSTMERLSTGFFGVPTTAWGRARDILIRFSGLIISVVLIMITTSVLADFDANGPSPCPKCRYVSCVPFPPWAGEENKWWYCDDCSQVTADAKLDSSGYYSLSMTCPNGEIEEIDLSDQLVTDRQWIQRQLPMMCRKNCDQVFGS